jgi:hypothetical protein
MLTTAFRERRAVPTHSALTTGKVDERVLKKMRRCWDYDPIKRPTASDLCEFFAGLKLEDNRDPEENAAYPRVTSDNTNINYDFVLDILQRVSVHLHLSCLICFGIEVDSLHAHSGSKCT